MALATTDPSADGRRRLVQRSTLGAGLALLLALAGITNYFAWKYHHRFDWTAERLFSLSEKTENVLAGLDRDIEVAVFMNPEDELAEPVQELLGRYEAASPRIEVRVVDAIRNPAEARAVVEQYEISRDNVVVFDSGDDRRVVEAADLAEYDYSGMQFGQGAQLEGFKGEQAFTSALVELMESEKPKILFTSGHGEARIDDFAERGLSGARDLLGKDNFEIESWASLGQPRVPEGTDLLVIAGPTLGFSEPEVATLRGYLQGGGRLLVLLDPNLDPATGLTATGLEGLLAEQGVEVGSDIVVDPPKAVPFFGAETFFIDAYGTHPVTDALSQAGYPVIFPLARSVTPGTAPEGFTATELLRTSSDGWGETDLANLRGVAKGDDDVAGPVGLAVAVEAEEDGGGEEGDGAEAAAADLDAEGGEGSGEPGAAGDGDADGEAASADAAAKVEDGAAGRRTMRLAVFGDADFATNGQIANAGNPTLLANTMNWLVERKALVAIPPKKPEQVRLSLTQGQLANVLLLVLGVLPGLAIAGGVTMWWRRRR